MHLVPVEAYNTMEALETESRINDDQGQPGPAPAWVVAMMPDQRRAEILEKITQLREEAERLQGQSQQMEPMGRLLWQAGQPLQHAVCRVFVAAGFEAFPAAVEAPYDVIVTLGDGKRLLVEVTSLEGPVTKTSPKVRQTFEAAQDGADSNDRIIIATNAYRERPVSDREEVDPFNSDALMILTGLGVVVVTTTTLYRIWCLSRESPEAAREYLLRLHSAPPGIFALDATRQPASVPKQNGEEKTQGSLTTLQRFLRL